ncbi:MAG: glycosyltransferase family 4 protein [Gemmatimonadales bacterium]|nr:glycosyltransferase family 4 protein [Gemmatimonadales bacterium]
MRIGVMLRHYDQHMGGVRVYTRKLLQAMLELRTGHEFVFLYRNPALVGSHGADSQVQEVALPARSFLGWDQIAVPRAVRRYGIDLLFNPKYSIPLQAGCPTVWVCHGLDWYVMPWASKFVDRLSHRFLVPRYASRAAAIVAVSEVTRQHVMQYLRVPPDRVVTVYSGVDDVFRRPLDPSRLAAVRAKHSLPDRFLLYAGAIYPPKNFTRLVRAYARVGPARGIPLVVAGGENRFLSEGELQEPAALGIGESVRWLGWVEQEELAALYALADALLLPSLFESCGLPVLEAMASGCPVVTADRYGTKELAEGAAVLVNPESVDAIAAGIERVLDDRELRTTLIAAGCERSREFQWRRTAVETLRVLERAAPERRPAGELAQGRAR